MYKYSFWKTKTISDHLCSRKSNEKPQNPL
jgi:hypothetical protein